jgi:hypothetical protein
MCVIGGVTLWEPKRDVFPSGMSRWMDLPLILHNRWFSPDNDYVKSGNFTMISKDMIDIRHITDIILFAWWHS